MLTRLRADLTRRLISRKSKTDQYDSAPIHLAGLAQLFTKNAQIYGRHHDENHRLYSGLEELHRENGSPCFLEVVAGISAFHAHLNVDEIPFLADRAGDVQKIDERTYRTMKELIRQHEISSVRSRFVHSDILLKRQSKQQLTLLADSRELKDMDMEGFLFCPIDTTVTRSRLGAVESIDASLSFSSLVDSLNSGSVIRASCSRCGADSHWEDESGLPSPLVCGNTSCQPDLVSRNSLLNPGGGRNYWGPVVPDLRNVWAGKIEKLVHKRNDRVVLITATVFQIFKDPSAGRSKKNIQLPSPDPRIQWTLLPIS